MPTVTLKKISKTQPMREGEIELLDYINEDMKTYLEQETQERVDEDGNLQTELNSEIQRATKAEETLQDNIEAETERATQAEQKLTDDLNSEVQRATAAEQKLTEDLNSEVTRATAAEQKLTDDLNSEVQRATAAEQKLTEDLNSEVTRATEKETELQQHIESETARATNAETELSGKIEAEETRATTAEAGIEEHLHTAEEEINGKIAALGGNGLTYDTDTGKLNVNQADRQTFGGVKLTHDVNNDTSDEWAVTSDGVYKYAPSKAETIAQPESFEFTDVQAGVTLMVQNIIRTCGIMFMNLRVHCGTDTTVSSNTKFATPPNSVGGVGIGISMSGIGIQISQVSLIVSKALEPNSDTYFTVVFPYKSNGGN